MGSFVSCSRSCALSVAERDVQKVAFSTIILYFLRPQLNFTSPHLVSLNNFGLKKSLLNLAPWQSQTDQLSDFWQDSTVHMS